MPSIISVSSYIPPHSIDQTVTTEFARELFQENFHDIERLLQAFPNGEIEQRNFAVPLEWFKNEHSLQERNDLYIDMATAFGAESIKACLQNPIFLKETVDTSVIDTIIFVSSSGMSTPSIDARIMNVLPFSPHTKRIPLWGLGCAGGAAGISRAFEYCKAFPKANVLVVCVELCGLTFQRNDRTKSNLIGTSLFADGAACALVCGDESNIVKNRSYPITPQIVASQSTLMADSEDVMGWQVKDSGLHVVFSRDIPNIIKKWLGPIVDAFLDEQQLSIGQLSSFIAHPGGKKVLEAYIATLEINEGLLDISKNILRRHGNMSSPTILYVLEHVMAEEHQDGDYGLMAALGPGFCSELVLLQWKGVH
ncbi:type III polyketide synthase [Anaerobacillus sp. MEB173]|uniref:type III polyketide synthase n=1 Tax=Anaerobacillus sp. MEB173 TaxID=3383345 RepID=UPI003F901489